MGVNRRALWFGGILIVAIVAVMAVRSMDDSSSAAPPSVTASRSRAALNSATRAEAPTNRPTESSQAPVDVNLMALGRERGEPTELGRNPFRFQPKAPPPPPPGPPVIRPGNESADTAMPVVPAGPPPPPPIALKFIGLVQRADGTRIAVLSDGRTTYHGVEGQDIDGRYRILKIGNESIEMAYIDGRGRQTIRLTGQ